MTKPPTYLDLINSFHKFRKDTGCLNAYQIALMSVLLDVANTARWISPYQITLNQIQDYLSVSRPFAVKLKTDLEMLGLIKFSKGGSKAGIESKFTLHIQEAYDSYFNVSPVNQNYSSPNEIESEPVNEPVNKNYSSPRLPVNEPVNQNYSSPVARISEDEDNNKDEDDIPENKFSGGIENTITENSKMVEFDLIKNSVVNNSFTTEKQTNSQQVDECVSHAATQPLETVKTPKGAQIPQNDFEPATIETNAKKQPAKKAEPKITTLFTLMQQAMYVFNPMVRDVWDGRHSLNLNQMIKYLGKIIENWKVEINPLTNNPIWKTTTRTIDEDILYLWEKVILGKYDEIIPEWDRENTINKEFLKIYQHRLKIISFIHFFITNGKQKPKSIPTSNQTHPTSARDYYGGDERNLDAAAEKFANERWGNWGQKTTANS